jgi:hypothetical protein
MMSAQYFTVPTVPSPTNLPHKIQMLGNHPKEKTQHSDNGESLKSRTLYTCSHHEDANVSGRNMTVITM